MVSNVCFSSQLLIWDSNLANLVLASMRLLPLLYGSINEGDCEGGIQSRDFFRFPSHFLQNTGEKMYFERNIWKERQNECNQEYWATFSFWVFFLFVFFLPLQTLQNPPLLSHPEDVLVIWLWHAHLLDWEH